MIIHCPHSSRKINGLIKFTNGKEKENLDFLTDTDIDYLFSHEFHNMIVFPFSRFVCDVERLPYDHLESKGQGIIYRRDIFGEIIERNIPDAKVYELYKMHHKKLNKSVNYSLTLFPKVVIVDAHSFTSKNENDPDVCIGTDIFHTPPDLTDIVVNFFNNKDYIVKINDPYNGTMVSQLHYQKTKDVNSIMIELNKKIYINNKEEMRSIIGECLDKISEFENK